MFGNTNKELKALLKSLEDGVYFARFSGIVKDTVLSFLANHKFKKEMFSNFDYEVKQSLNDNFVECETCGCLLKKETAFRGKSEVVTEIINGGFYTEETEKIKENYYCKIHKPKSK